MKKKILCFVVILTAGVQLAIAQNCTVSISGNNCIGSQLTANTGEEPLSTLTWTFYGFSVYVADTVSSPASVSVVAGNHGAGTGADQFGFPAGGIALDNAGNVYVADYRNNRVQKWVPGASSGITVAGGNGAGSAANQLNGPKDVFVDAGGNIYVADNANARIQKWVPGSSSGITVAGGNDPGSSDQQLNGPAGVYVDAAGSIYIADIYNQRIQKWTPGATKGTTVAGGNGYGDAANQFYYPTDVYLDGAGNIYVADVFTENSDYHRVQKWAPGASSGITVAGGPGVFGYLLAITVDAAGNLYTADNGISGTPISRVQKWAPGASTGITVAGGHNNGWDQLLYPTGVALDANNNLYVLDGTYSPKVQKYIPTNGVVNNLFTPTQPGSYTVQALYKDGCTATSTAVNIIALPLKPEIVAATSESSSNLCNGGTATFLVNNPEDNVSYSWTIPPKCKLLANLGDSIVISLTPGFSLGYLTVAASNSCGLSERDSLKIEGMPSKPSKISGPKAVAPGSLVVYSVEDNGTIYRWAVPAGAIITAGQNTATMSVKWGAQPGFVNVYAANQCGVSANQQLHVSVKSSTISIAGTKTMNNEARQNVDAVIYPNPAKDRVTLAFNAPHGGKYNIIVQDIVGKILMYKEAVFTAGRNQLPIDMQQYAGGMYIIKIKSGNRDISIIKLMKQ